jgi:hypothetical protein
MKDIRELTALFKKRTNTSELKPGDEFVLLGFPLKDGAMTVGGPHLVVSVVDGVVTCLDAQSNRRWVVDDEYQFMTLDDRAAFSEELKKQIGAQLFNGPFTDRR